MTKRRRRNLRVERWKRAVELAKILFDDQGYHSRYLDDLLDYALGSVETQEPPADDVATRKTPNRRRHSRCR